MLLPLSSGARKRSRKCKPANALQLEAARGTPESLYDAIYPLPYYSVFADTLVYDVALTFDLEHWQCIARDVMKLCTEFECNRAIPRRSYCDFSI